MLDPTLDLHSEINRRCQQVFAAGVFDNRGLSCLPQVRQGVERALCSIDAGGVWLPYAAGFGVGAENVRTELPDRLSLQYYRHTVDPAAWNEWRAGHCRNLEPSIDIEADWVTATENPEATRVAMRMHEILARTREAFAAARAAAPATISGPWERCAEFVDTPQMGEKTAGIACHLIGTSGEAGETLYFSMQHILHPDATDPLLLPIPLPRLQAPKLRGDLRIEGATCPAQEWVEGRRLPGVHALRCERDGAGEVTFRLSTSKGDCVATLPAVVEVGPEDSCGEPEAAEAAVELPFRWPPFPCPRQPCGSASTRNPSSR